MVPQVEVPQDETFDPGPLMRKSHRKSRRGCTHCKQRHLKCDEVVPACSFCVQRSLDCQYLPPAKRKPAGSKRLESTPPDQPIKPPLAQPVSYCHDAFDMQLLQHWTLHVSRTLSQERRDLVLWRHRVPSIAFAYPVVMHGLLAISALSLSRCPTADKSLCLRRAEVHHSHSLSRMIAELQHVERDNAEALFVAATLLSFHHFAVGPQRGQYLVFSEHSTPDWLGLLNGVRSTVERLPDKGLHIHDNLAGIEDVCDCDLLGRPPRISPLSYREPLAQLRNGINSETFDEGHGPVYQVALDQLEWCFANGLIDDGHAEGLQPISHLVMAWFYMLGPAFISSMKARHPWALIVLAHFVVLLHQLRSCWLTDGWSLHIMRGIQKHVPPDLERWLSWPMQVLRLCNRTSMSD